MARGELTVRSPEEEEKRHSAFERSGWKPRGKPSPKTLSATAVVYGAATGVTLSSSAFLG